MSPPLSVWHALDPTAVEAELATRHHGLSLAEIAARRARHGWNEIEPAPPTSALVVLLHQFQSPLIYILLVSAGVTLALGHLVDTGVIAGVLALNAAIASSRSARRRAPCARSRSSSRPAPGGERFAPAATGAAAASAGSPLALSLLAGVLANEAELCRTPSAIETSGDATEAALLRVAVLHGLQAAEARAEWT